MNLIVDGIPCIKISDPEVKRILLEKLDKDGNGEINVSESENISVGAWFYENKKIRTFNEAKKFKGLYTANNNSFAESSIEEIEFSAGQSLAGGAFNNCLNLHHIVLPSDMTHLNWFTNNQGLEYIELPETIEKIDANQLSYSGLREISVPHKMTSIVTGLCMGCEKLSKVVITSQIASIDMKSFSETPNLKTLIIHTVIPPTFGWAAFSNTNPLMRIYVPDASVNVYKTATGWKSKADYIYPISQYKE